MPPPRNRGPPSREVTVSKALSLILRHAAEKEGLKMDSQGYASVPDVLAWRKLKSIRASFPELIAAVATSDKKRFALLHIPSAEAEASANTTSGEEAGDTLLTGGGASVPTTAAGQDNATTTALAAAETDKEPSHYLIRATQGHSIKSVDAAAFQEKLSLEDESKLPGTVVHGTYHAAWPAILESGGLRCMRRNQVHFATGPTLESALPSQAGETAGGESQVVISGMRRDAQVLIYIDLKRALAAGCPFWRSENGVILSEGISAGEGEMLVPTEFFDVVVERKRGMGKIWEKGQVLQELPAELFQKNPKGNQQTGGKKN